ncbi:MAG: transcription factor S [Nanoarchaeota archaeon]|nr:transcription factor S [Nanoarchaeota archaeon]|tara:strand:- start:4906 stop:5223 length:318 start_codon:yes stop_codon:yes gene_type:complete
MKFCDHCGSMLVPDKSGKKKLVCMNCGKKIPLTGEKVVLKEDIKEKDKVEVVDAEVEVNPKVDMECPKCEHTKAYTWALQTRASDEGETRFYKCAKCGNRWRVYE